MRAGTWTTIRVKSESDGTFWAEVEEMPGCFATGSDVPELFEALTEAMRIWSAKRERA